MDMKTIKHNYFYDVSIPHELKDYRSLIKKLEISHAGKFFNTYSHKNGEKNGTFETVELDITCLFNNQWNETGVKGRRLFDWREGIYPNKNIHAGYWLEITQEMQEIRDNTLTCGYCGKYARVNKPHKWYCQYCLGNEYLKEKDLHLIRLFPVSLSHKERDYSLSQLKLAEILPLWKEAQGLGQIQRDAAKASKNRQRVANLIPDALKESSKLLENAKVQTEALTWLLDHEINILDNVIYYPHTKKFNFGWMKALNEENKLKLISQLDGFPFEYEINHQ